MKRRSSESEEGLPHPAGILKDAAEELTLLFLPCGKRLDDRTNQWSSLRARGSCSFVVSHCSLRPNEMLTRRVGLRSSPGKRKLLEINSPCLSPRVPLRVPAKPRPPASLRWLSVEMKVPRDGNGCLAPRPQPWSTEREQRKLHLTVLKLINTDDP